MRTGRFTTAHFRRGGVDLGQQPGADGVRRSMVPTDTRRQVGSRVRTVERTASRRYSGSGRAGLLDENVAAASPDRTSPSAVTATTETASGVTR